MERAGRTLSGGNCDLSRLFEPAEGVRPLFAPTRGRRRGSTRCSGGRGGPGRNRSARRRRGDTSRFCAAAQIHVLLRRREVGETGACSHRWPKRSCQPTTGAPSSAVVSARTLVHITRPRHDRHVKPERDSPERRRSSSRALRRTSAVRPSMTRDVQISSRLTPFGLALCSLSCGSAATNQHPRGCSASRLRGSRDRRRGCRGALQPRPVAA